MPDRILYPVGAASSFAPVYAAAIAVNIWNNKSVVTVAQLTGNATFNLVPEADIRLGARVAVKFSADGTNRTVTPGANITGAAIAVNANKVVSVEFEWDGASFVHRSTQALN